jgi:hypothetical protein
VRRPGRLVRTAGQPRRRPHRAHIVVVVVATTAVVVVVVGVGVGAQPATAFQVTRPARWCRPQTAAAAPDAAAGCRVHVLLSEATQNAAFPIGSILLESLEDVVL